MPKVDEQFAQQLIAMQPRLRAYIYAQLADWAASEDVLQQVNLVLCRKSAEAAGIENFNAWAYQVAHFEVANHHRKTRRERHRIFDDALVEKVSAAAAEKLQSFDFRREALERCLLTLTSEQRDLLAQRYGLESATPRTVAEIAKENGRRAGSLRQALYKIRIQLLDCVKRHATLGARHERCDP